MVLHMSDCALHNAPALPVGPCDCGAEEREASTIKVRPAPASFIIHGDEELSDECGNGLNIATAGPGAFKPAPAQLPEAVLRRMEESAESGEFSVQHFDDIGTITESYRLIYAHISDLTRRLSEAEAELSGVGVRQYREAVERLHKAEARVREMEATIDAMAEAHAHDDMALTAAYLNGAHAGKKQAEAFTARVMAWARGRCGCCEHEGSEGDTCYDCNSDDERSNWTPPQAWEVGE